MKRTIALLATVLAVIAAQAAIAGEIRVKSGTSIQDAVRRANAGDTILVEPGEYKETVYVDKQNITLRGLRDRDEYAVLNGEFELNDGLIASGHGVVIDGFKVKGYKGNAIMTQGANNFQIINNYVEGAFYGIFPQFGKNGLVKGNTVTGSEDAGIYVGMSDNVDVIDNVATGNVMGLEFENTRNALMADNLVYGNTAGIALTLVPGLPVKDASDIVIRDNIIKDNNLENFAPSSSIAAQVPKGVGILVVGPDRVTVENNIIENNGNAGLFTIDTVSFGLNVDPKVDPYSDQIRVMSNRWANNGSDMSGVLGGMVSATGQDGFEVISAGKGHDSCLFPDKKIQSLGTNRWAECTSEMSVTNYETAMLSEPFDSPEYTLEQKGRLTYVAVCTGCHTYDSVLHGPSIRSIQALYRNNAQGLADYAAAPVVKREGFPEMPPQDYLGVETLNAIATYILEELEDD